jgi:hypothetical protein
MTIATLILTCVLFVALGWTGDMYSPIALCVGAIVCIAAANAGTTSQDLKTGYIVGATPYYQQVGLVIGVLTSGLIIGITMLYMHQVFGIGSADVPAPQATLMSTIITGLLNQNLPWGLVLVGIFITVTLELCGVHSENGRWPGVRRQRRDSFQLGPDCRRVDRRDPLCHPCRNGHDRAVAGHWDGISLFRTGVSCRRAGQLSALHRAGGHRGPYGDAQSRMIM